jgi:hypothetical protein
VRGGGMVHTVLHLGPRDTGVARDGGRVEWDVVAGPAGGKATDRLARHVASLVPGRPLVASVDVAVPERHDHARLAAVVRIVGAGEQPRLAQGLTESSLEVRQASRR